MFARLVVLSLLVGGCKKEEPPKPAPKAAAPKPVKAPIIAAVNFETGSAKIPTSEEGVIDSAAEIMKNSDWTVLVLGLADATGDADANKILSRERAEAVAARLRQRVSVPANRIVVHAIGERLADGGSNVSERKVEFVFFHDEGLPLKEVVIRSRVLQEDFRTR
jgi:outer membrane protein OmpA-like peptidoglycan-associated protein